MNWASLFGGGATDPQTGELAGGSDDAPVQMNGAADDGASSIWGTIGATAGSLADAYAKIETSKAQQKAVPVIGKDNVALPGWVWIAGIVLLLAIVAFFVMRKRG